MDCDLIDLRLSPVYPDEPADTSVHSSAVVAELYIRDRTISIPSLTKNGVLSESVHKILQNRHLKLHHAFIMALEGGDPYVLIHNWFPYEDQRQRLQGSKETQHLEVFLNARRIQGLTKRLVSQAEQVSAPVGAERSLSASEGPSNPANRKRRYSTGMAKDLTLSVPNGPDGFVKSPSASSFTGRSDDAILPVASVPAGVGRVISPIEINVTETGSFTSTMSKTLPEQAMELADTLSSIYFAHFELHALDGMSGYDTPRSKARYRPESEQTSEARADLDIADPVPPGETATPVGESSSTGTFFSLKKFAKVAHSDSVGAVEATQLKQNLLSPERTSDYGARILHLEYCSKSRNVKATLNFNNDALLNSFELRISYLEYCSRFRISKVPCVALGLEYHILEYHIVYCPCFRISKEQRFLLGRVTEYQFLNIAHFIKSRHVTSSLCFWLRISTSNLDYGNPT
eukprot:g6624.t1